MKRLAVRVVLLFCGSPSARGFVSVSPRASNVYQIHGNDGDHEISSISNRPDRSVARRRHGIQSANRPIPPRLLEAESREERLRS